MAGDARLDADPADQAGLGRCRNDPWQRSARAQEGCGKRRVGIAELDRERRFVLAVSALPLDDLNPESGLTDALDIGAEPEAVEQLRPQLALLRIHRADQDEPGRMDHRDALALDDVDTHRGGVEEDIHDVVVEEVDLVHIKEVAVGLGQDAGLETAVSMLESGLQVDAAHHPVLRRVDRQLYDPHVPGRHRQRSGLGPHPALHTQRLREVRIAAEVAPLDHVLLRQQPGQAPDRRRLAGPPLPADQDTADGGTDGVCHQGQLHPFLADDGRERVDLTLELGGHADQAYPRGAAATTGRADRGRRPEAPVWASLPRQGWSEAQCVVGRLSTRAGPPNTGSGVQSRWDAGPWPPPHHIPSEAE